MIKNYKPVDRPKALPVFCGLDIGVSLLVTLRSSPNFDSTIKKLENQYAPNCE